MSLEKNQVAIITADAEATQNTNDNTVDFSLIALLPNGKVEARKLYKFLELRHSDVARWLDSKITKNEFVTENEDYWGFSTIAEGNKIQDFELTPKFAKKLCMMSKSKIGELARDYFLAMEEKAKISLQPKTEEDLILQLFPEAPTELVSLTANSIREKKALSLQLEHKEIIIDNLSTVFNHESNWISILKVAMHNKISEKLLKFSILKKKSKELGYEVKKFPSRKYGYQNGYHRIVFQACYPALKYDFKDLETTNLTLTGNV